MNMKWITSIPGYLSAVLRIFKSVKTIKEEARKDKKSFWQSDTVRLAVTTIITSIVTILSPEIQVKIVEFVSENRELAIKYISGGAGVLGTLLLYLRANTTQPIK